MATIDAATNTNVVALEPELPSATAKKIENEQQTLQYSDAKPGAALAAFGSSPLNVRSGADVDLAARITGAEQSITSDTDQLLGLMNQSLTATEFLSAVDAGAGGESGRGIEGVQTPLDALNFQLQIAEIQPPKR
ncbi:MAG: hypothetical protein ACR2P1_02870 [Pseudomonadales bacterium]